MSKEYKFSLGSDLLKQNWILVDLFIGGQTASSAEKKKIKRKIIKRLSLTFDRFKVRIRFLRELKLISLG